MKELYFIGMDVAEETKILTDFTTSICTIGMTENESKAYNLGVKNTLSALNEILEIKNNEFVVNIPGMEIQEEFDILDLEHYLSNI